MKALIRDMMAMGLSVAQVSDRRLRRPNTWLILTFHRILPETLRAQYPLGNLAVTPAELDWVITVLKSCFTIKTVADAYSLITAGDDYPPLLSITFDDGQWDNVEYALPVLQQHNIKATFYLTADYIGSKQLLWHDRAAYLGEQLATHPVQVQDYLDALPAAIRSRVQTSSPRAYINALKQLTAEERAQALAGIDSHRLLTIKPWLKMMSWDDARKLAACGHELGSHGCSHELLPQQTALAQRQELQRSRELMQQQLQLPVATFCYPNGDYINETIALVAECGYRAAVTTQWGVNMSISSPFELLRCDINPQTFVDRRGALSAPRLKMRLGGLVSVGGYQ